MPCRDWTSCLGIGICANGCGHPREYTIDRSIAQLDEKEKLFRFENKTKDKEEEFINKDKEEFINKDKEEEFKDKEEEFEKIELDKSIDEWIIY